MAHMMTRMTRWLAGSLARWLAVCQDPFFTMQSSRQREEHWSRKQVHCTLKGAFSKMRIYDSNDSVPGALKDR